METKQIKPVIEQSWKQVLIQDFNAESFLKLREFLQEEKKKYVIYPPGDKIFNAFDKTPFEEVKVVIIGQDPYHGPGQAHGLSFSVPDGIAQPPSLKNIFKEINKDLGYDIPSGGNLESWARQGVLLLNATLTVRAHTAGSHQHKGWEEFTDAVIRKISEERSGVVFMLWGRYAQAKEELIDHQKHFVLKAAHPSPFSADRGFFGCRHFSKANRLLKEQGKKEIDWRIQ